jgi:hypothetical protein
MNNIPSSTLRSTTPPPVEAGQPVPVTAQPAIVPGSEGTAPTAPLLTTFAVFVSIIPDRQPTPEPPADPASESEQLRQIFSDLNVRERASRGLARLAAMEGNPATTADIGFDGPAKSDQKASPK